MTFKPTGLWPLLSRVAGLGIMLYAGLIAINFLYFLITNRPANEWLTTLSVAAVLVLIVGVFAYFGYLLVGAFPTLTVTAAGLVVRHPLGEKHTFQWTEIERVTTRSKHLDGVVLSAKGAPFWWPWRLYRYYVYGMFVHYLRPGILIAGKREHRAELIATIQQHLDQKPAA